MDRRTDGRTDGRLRDFIFCPMHMHSIALDRQSVTGIEALECKSHKFHFKVCTPWLSDRLPLRIELYAPEFHATFFISVFLSKLLVLVLVLVIIGFANTRKSIGNTNTNIYFQTALQY